jgi:hypothetical protein
MKYMLLIHTKESDYATMSKAEGEQRMGAYMAYAQAMHKAGVSRGGERLKSISTASTVRVADGKTKVQDGPYADTKEQLGGYFIIEVPDLDQALSWAAKCPGAAHGAVEVRPIWEM